MPTWACYWHSQLSQATSFNCLLSLTRLTRLITLLIGFVILAGYVNIIVVNIKHIYTATQADGEMCFQMLTVYFFTLYLSKLFSQHAPGILFMDFINIVSRPAPSPCSFQQNLMQVRQQFTKPLIEDVDMKITASLYNFLS